MARLNNTTSPRKRQDPPPRAIPQSQQASCFLARTTGISNKEHGHWTTTSAETSSTKGSVGGLGDIGTSMHRKQSQKKKGKNSTDFRIFYDSDAFVEREAEESEGEEGSSIASSLSASSSSSPFSHSASSHTSSDSLQSHDVKTKNPLSLAHVNSMILPLSQQPARISRRPTTATATTTTTTATAARITSPEPEETDNYDKENEPIEQEPEDDTVSSLTRSSSDASSRTAPIRRNNSQTSGKDRRTGPLFSTYRQRETVEEQGDSEVDVDNGIDDSLNDFVVSDNEDLSYQETSGSDDSEEEEERKKTPSSPPLSRPKRRLMRGRRPAPRLESEPQSGAEVEKSWKTPSHRGQSPVESTDAPLPSPGVKPQDNGIITDKLGDLNLEDNDPSCQLLQGLNE